MKLFVIKGWWTHNFLDDPLCLFVVYLMVFNATFNNRDNQLELCYTVSSYLEHVQFYHKALSAMKSRTKINKK
jgi:protein involved in temperature-dependent protein secretion